MTSKYVIVSEWHWFLSLVLVQINRWLFLFLSYFWPPKSYIHESIPWHSRVILYVTLNVTYPISESRPYTRSSKSVAASEFHKSAITDHVVTDNHVMDWDNIRVLNREEDSTRRWIKEAIWIRKSMPVRNRDEGATNCHICIYDSLITIPTFGDQSSWWRWRMSSKRRST